MTHPRTLGRGDRVRHEHFGRGTVLATPRRDLILVQFDRFKGLGRDGMSRNRLRVLPRRKSRHTRPSGLGAAAYEVHNPKRRNPR